MLQFEIGRSHCENLVNIINRAFRQKMVIDNKILLKHGKVIYDNILSYTLQE